MSLRRCCSIAIVTLGLAGGADAQVVRTWDGEDSTNFFDVGENWSGNVTPGALDTARFTSPFTGTYSVLWDDFTGNRTTATVEVLAGDVTFRRDSGAPRTYTVTNATINAGRLQLNDITLAFGGTMTVNNNGRLDINAAGTIAGGSSSSLVLAGGGQVFLSAGRLTANSITASSGFNFAGGTLVTPNFTGPLTQDGGTLSPGDVGVRDAMTIAQGYAMTAGTFAADLVGTNTDQLIVGGPVSLAGALSLNNISFPTTRGTSRILVDGTSVTGRFATVEGLELTPNRYAAVTYTASQALMTVALPGDATLSAGVGFPDLVLLAQNYNLNGRTWSTADFDGDGTSGFSDLVLLAQNYGLTSLGLPDGASADFAADWALAQSMIPEPTLMLAWPLVMTIARRRRPM